MICVILGERPGQLFGWGGYIPTHVKALLSYTTQKQVEILGFVYELSAPEWLGIRTSKKQAQDHVPLPYQVANGRPARMPEFSGKAENLLLTHS